MSYPTEPPREAFEVQSEAAAPAPRVWKWWGALLLVLGTLAVQIAVGIIGMIILMIGEAAAGLDVERWSMPVLTVGGPLGVLLLLLLLRKRIAGAKPLWDSQDLKDWRSWVLAFIALLISAGANIARIFIERDPAPPELNQQILKMMEASPSTPWVPLILMGIGVIVLAPLTEEWLFRGILLPAIQRAFGAGRERLGAWIAVPMSSLIFGLLHWPTWWVPAVYGAVIGLISLRQRSLAVPMLVHFLINLIVYSLVVSAG